MKSGVVPAWLVVLLVAGVAVTGVVQAEQGSDQSFVVEQRDETPPQRGELLAQSPGVAEATEQAQESVGDAAEQEAETGADASEQIQRPSRPPAPDVLVVREEYDSRCSDIAFRMALEPTSLTTGELERLGDCVQALLGGAAVAESNPQMLCGQYCAAVAAPACPPPPRPNLAALCPPYMEEQRQQRSEDRRQRQVRPHLPGL